MPVMRAETERAGFGSEPALQPMRLRLGPQRECLSQKLSPLSFDRVEPSKGGTHDVSAMRICVEEPVPASVEVSHVPVPGVGPSFHGRSLSEVRACVEDEAPAVGRRRIHMSQMQESEVERANGRDHKPRRWDSTLLRCQGPSRDDARCLQGMWLQVVHEGRRDDIMPRMRAHGKLS